MLSPYFIGMIIAGVIGGVVGYIRNRKKETKEMVGQVLKWTLVSFIFGMIGLIILLLIEFAGSKNKTKRR